ncbi:MAG: hypothetical protein JWN36_3248 [Microbacteriaceae bacterium]|nr:hypothetical protein [Microbacteriaceae bacterium]
MTTPTQRFTLFPTAWWWRRYRSGALGYEPLDAFIEYAGGYVDDSTAVVTVAGETEDEEEWFHRYLVDPHTGEIRRRLDVPSAHQYDFEPLGDGSWLSTTDDGRLRRHTLNG